MALDFILYARLTAPLSSAATYRMLAAGLVQLGGHFGFQGGYARDRDEFRPRAAVPFNLDPDSDDDSSVVRPAVWEDVSRHI